MYIACESVSVWDVCLFFVVCPAVVVGVGGMVDDLGLAQAQEVGVTSFLFEHPVGWSTRTTCVLLCGPSGWEGREAGKGGGKRISKKITQQSRGRKIRHRDSVYSIFVLGG